MDWSSTSTATEEYQADLDDQLRVIEGAARMCRECERCEETWVKLPSGVVERCDCYRRYCNAVRGLKKKAPRDWEEHMTDKCWNLKQRKDKPLMSDERFEEMRKLQNLLIEDVIPGDGELKHVSAGEWESILSLLPPDVGEKLRATFRLERDVFAEAN